MHASRHREFARALLDPGLAAPAGLCSATGSAQRGFDVHRNNVVVALVDALAEAFPVTRVLVGDACFRTVARDYIAVDPPRSPVLLEYGDRFPAFLTACAPLLGVPYLADLARLESLRTQAYHAADAIPIGADAYRTLAVHPERLARTRVALHPACRWLQSPYAVHSIWTAHQGLADPADADLAAVDIDRPEAVLVTRPRFDVLVRALPSGGATWLDMLKAGRTIADAMSAACNVDAHADAASLFGLLVQHDLAVDLHSVPEV
jgi:hypothetical protein